MKNHIIILSLLTSWFSVTSQDIHFSQFDFVSSYNNPASTGILPEHNYGAIYRDQGFRVSSNAYESLGLFGDFQLNTLPRKNDRLGLGFVLLRDIAGIGKVETIEFLINPVYHLSLDESTKHRLSFSPQFGFVQRGLGDLDAFTFEEELLGGQFSENFLDGTSSYLDLNIGFMYTGQYNDQHQLKLGVSLHHFNNTNDAFSTLNIDKIGFRRNGFLQFQYQLNDKFTLQPQVQFQDSDQYQELIFQNFFRFELDRKKDRSFAFGIGYRSKDAIQLIAQVEMGSITIGAAYDNNTSSLAQVSDPVSGLEIGLKYRRKINRKKSIDEIPLIPMPSISWNAEFELHHYDIGLVEINKETIVTEEDSEEQPALDVPFPMIGEDLFALDKIYYDFDKWNILQESEFELNKLFDFMQKHPDVIIELASHTDSRGDDAYNLTLSQHRALSAKTWLVKRGILSHRIIPKGYGESQLSNHCMNDVPCSRALHRKNRRTEFKIIR